MPPCDHLAGAEGVGQGQSEVLQVGVMASYSEEGPSFRMGLSSLEGGVTSQSQHHYLLVNPYCM